MRIRTTVVFTFAVLLTSCATADTVASTGIPDPTSTSAVTSTQQTPTPQPTANVPIESAPTSEPERWMEYETALAEVFLPLPYLPGKGLCEWELLGQSEREVYVWAMCQVAESVNGAAMSAPAVIHLGPQGVLGKVDVPGDGFGYQTRVYQMFPPDLHEIILAQSINVDGMWSHLQLRHEKPQVPLIVALGVTLP